MNTHPGTALFEIHVKQRWKRIFFFFCIILIEPTRISSRDSDERTAKKSDKRLKRSINLTKASQERKGRE